MKRLIQEEPFEETGKFWLPESPESPVDGTLRYSPGGFTEVALMGSFLSDPTDGSERRAVVHGQTMRGQKISLLGAAEDMEHLSATGTRGRIHAPCLLMGGHCEPETAQRFSEAVFRFTSLEQWYWKRLFVRSLDQTGSTVERVEGDLGHSFRSEYLSATIEFFLTERSSEPSRGEIRVGHDTRIRLRPDAPQDLAWFDEHRRSIQRLLILLVGDLVAAREVFLRDTTDAGYSYAFADWLPTNSCTEHHMHRMPFSFSAVRDRFTDLLDKWFRLEGSCGEAIVLLFSTLTKATAPQPYEFLSRVQAVEGILRPLTSGK